MPSQKSPLPGAALPSVAAALALGAGAAQAQAPSQPVAPPAAPTTQILAIGHATPKFTPDVLRTVLPEELRDTVRLYLQGKIGDWYMRNDRPGVVFILNTTDPKEARRLMDALPFGRDGLMDFDLIPLGPLSPLALLLKDPPA